MHSIISSSDARKNWSEVIDTVVRKSPVFIKRNRDSLSFLSMEHLDLILDTYKFNLTLMMEEDGSYTVTMDEIDLATSSNSEEEAIDDLCSEIIEYAKEYLDNFDSYYHSTNRKSHFPYIYKILANNFDKDIVKK